MLEDPGFGAGESEHGCGFGDLVEALAEQDPCLGVGEETLSDFCCCGAVVGLGSEVGDAVSDGDVGDAVVAGQFLAGLEVAGGSFLTEQRPDLFPYLYSAGPCVGRRISLEVSDGAKSLPAKIGYDPAFGARPLKRVIQSEVADELAVQILDGHIEDGAKVIVGVTSTDGDFTFEIV